MSYEILEHTADEKFQAVGETLEEGFSEATKAFGEVVGSDPNAGQYRHDIEVESENLEALLFDFLDRLIYLQDTEGVLVCQAEDVEVEEKDDSYILNATILVDPITRANTGLDIKGPTYNEMKIGYEKEEGWVLQVVIDI